MTVAVRTNRAINPRVGTNSTNYAAVPGTGGAASGARNVGTGYTGAGGFYRVTWSTATTAVSGGANYTQTGLSAATQYSFKVWVRASKAQTVRLSAQFQTAALANVGSAVVSSNVVLTANTWTPTPLTINGATSGAAVDRVVLSMAATTGGSNWAAADTFDIGLVLIETGAAAGEGFTGASTSTTGLPTNTTYAWTGTADASTSTETIRTITLTATDTTTGGQSPRAQLVVTDAGPGTYTAKYTRLCEGVTTTVQGAVARALSDSDVVNDYACPLQRLTVYSLVINDVVMATASVTVAATTAWLSDPLQPDKSIPVKLDGNNPGHLTLEGESLGRVSYPSGTSTVQVMGSSFPTSLGGQASQAAGVPLRLWSDDEATGDAFRALLLDAPVLLMRPMTNMRPLPALSFMTRQVEEEDVSRKFGGTVALWHWTGDIVAAVTRAVVSGVITYDDVQALISTSNTYAQVQTKSAAKTYLDWQKNPEIWSTL